MLRCWLGSSLQKFPGGERDKGIVLQFANELLELFDLTRHGCRPEQVEALPQGWIRLPLSDPGGEREV